MAGNKLSLPLPGLLFGTLLSLYWTSSIPVIALFIDLELAAKVEIKVDRMTITSHLSTNPARRLNISKKIRRSFFKKDVAVKCMSPSSLIVLVAYKCDFLGSGVFTAAKIYISNSAIYVVHRPKRRKLVCFLYRLVTPTRQPYRFPQYLISNREWISGALTSIWTIGFCLWSHFTSVERNIQWKNRIECSSLWKIGRAQLIGMTDPDKGAYVYLIDNFSSTTHNYTLCSLFHTTTSLLLAQIGRDSYLGLTNFRYSLPLAAICMINSATTAVDTSYGSEPTVFSGVAVNGNSVFIDLVSLKRDGSMSSEVQTCVRNDMVWSALIPGFHLTIGAESYAVHPFDGVKSMWGTVRPSSKYNLVYSLTNFQRTESAVAFLLNFWNLVRKDKCHFSSPGTKSLHCGLENSGSTGRFSTTSCDARLPVLSSDASPLLLQAPTTISLNSTASLSETGSLDEHCQLSGSSSGLKSSTNETRSQLNPTDREAADMMMGPLNKSSNVRTLKQAGQQIALQCTLFIDMCYLLETRIRAGFASGFISSNLSDSFGFTRAFNIIRQILWLHGSEASVSTLMLLSLMIDDDDEIRTIKVVPIGSFLSDLFRILYVRLD
ncbi:hypothetical protein CLF_111393 [Clonorchis sinensis]|uniref:Uncharacterized protein n=1 Tax=Clonorchis sinensis TaxID=79923 RepID=G7YUS8_CLOSI|nr:hypothetical protein CLF_111393 [Clonorchis sinensis]